jgi:hypothetical protein
MAEHAAQQGYTAQGPSTSHATAFAYSPLIPACPTCRRSRWRASPSGPPSPRRAPCRREPGEGPVSCSQLQSVACRGPRAPRTLGALSRPWAPSAPGLPPRARAPPQPQGHTSTHAPARPRLSLASAATVDSRAASACRKHRRTRRSTAHAALTHRPLRPHRQDVLLLLLHQPQLPRSFPRAAPWVAASFRQLPQQQVRHPRPAHAAQLAHALPGQTHAAASAQRDAATGKGSQR